MACHHLSTEGLKVLLLAVFLQQSRGFVLAGHFERGQRCQLPFGVQGQCFFLIHAQTLCFSPGYNQQILLTSILSLRAVNSVPALCNRQGVWYLL